MIDGIKIMDLKVDAKDLLENEALNFAGHHSIRTGEDLNFNKKIKYKGLDITIKPNGVATLNGSLHTFFNDGGQNYNDYNFNNIQDTIDRLCNKFGIDPDIISLSNVEFGLNITLSFPPQLFIKSIINHKGEPFSPMSRAIVKKGMGIECVHDQYYIKIYDKGAQCDLDEYLLRIEIKATRSAYFKLNGIPLTTLSDLKNRPVYSHLKEKFMSILSELLYCDSYEDVKQELDPNEILILAEGKNPRFWVDLKPGNDLKKTNIKQYEQKRRKYYSTLSLFKSIVEMHNLNVKIKTIEDLAAQKWDDLINPSPQSSKDKFTDLSEYKITDINKTDSGQIHTIDKVGTCEHQIIRRCLVTGADISDQKSVSKFVSEKKVGYLQAHRIRNAYHDPRRNLKRRINKYDDKLTLFDMKDSRLLDLSTDQMYLLAQ